MMQDKKSECPEGRKQDRALLARNNNSNGWDVMKITSAEFVKSAVRPNQYPPGILPDPKFSWTDAEDTGADEPCALPDSKSA